MRRHAPASACRSDRAIVTSTRRLITRGAALSATAVVAARAASLVTQLVLGAALTDDDWGTYAAALAIASLVTGFRDAGVADLIAERGEATARQSLRSISRLAAATNLAIAALLLAASFPARRHFSADEVAYVLWLTAAALVLATPAAIARGLLRSRLDFAVLAQTSVVTALLRACSAIGFGLADFGATSFALGLPAIAVIESLLLWRAAAKPPSGTAATPLAETQDLGLIGRDTGWLLAAAAGTGLLVNGDYLVLSFALDAAVLGQYFFAYRLVSQASTLVTASLSPVLIPGLTRIRNDPTRLTTTMTDALLVLGTCLAPASLVLAVNFEALDALIWDGAWLEARIAIWCLAIVFPVRATFSLARALLISDRRYQRVALLTIALALGLVAITTLASALTENIGSIAGAVAAYLFIAIIAVHGTALHSIGVAAAPVLGSLGRPVIIGWLCAAAVWALDEYVAGSLAPLGRIAMNTLAFCVLYAFGTLGANRRSVHLIRELIGYLRPTQADPSNSGMA